MNKHRASEFARAWLAVAQASGKDKDLPGFYKTVIVEQFASGVRLVACDGYLLAMSWVPLWGESAFPPPLDVAPDRTVLVSDPGGRARSLAGYALSIDSEDDGFGEPLELAYDVRVEDGEDASPHLDGLEPTFVTLELPDRERVYLPVVDADPFGWRRPVGDFTPITTDYIALNPELVERVAKIRKWQDRPIQWQWAGKEKAGRWEYRDAWPPIEGLIMPMRLDAPTVEGADE